MKNTSCIAVIPARGGSKRIPKKNIKLLGGMPLIGYTVEAAVKSCLFQRIVVSTDCPEIAEIARNCGAEIPFLRSPDLSDDHTPVSAATVDVLRKLDPDGLKYGAVCQLMPNCPLKNAGDITESYRQFLDTNTESQLSVVRYGWQNPWWAMRRDREYRLDAVFRDYITQRSQDLPELYCPTGAIWWAQIDALRREGTFHLEGKTGWEIPWQRGLDIDTQADWEMAEVLFRTSKQRSKNGPPGDTP
jgi:CMP-N-acetylneuraminic acid synthetase